MPSGLKVQNDYQTHHHHHRGQIDHTIITFTVLTHKAHLGAVGARLPFFLWKSGPRRAPTPRFAAQKRKGHRAFALRPVKLK